MQWCKIICASTLKSFAQIMRSSYLRLRSQAQLALDMLEKHVLDQTADVAHRQFLPGFLAMRFENEALLPENGTPNPRPGAERELFIDNLLVRIYFIIVMIRWTGLAPWEFEFTFPGSLTSTFLGPGALRRAGSWLGRFVRTTPEYWKGLPNVNLP